MKAIDDIDDPRLAKALAHPLRVRILAVLERRAASPKELADELAQPLENLSYHVRALRDFGLIRLEQRRMVGGAVQHIYRAAGRPRVTARAWSELPDMVKEAMSGAALAQIGELVGEAAAQGSFTRPESLLARRPVRLDEPTFGEACAILCKALDDISALQHQAARRIEEGATAVEATAVAMLFDTPGGHERAAP